MRLLPVSSVTAAAISMWRAEIAAQARRSSAQRSATGVRRHAGCAARARSTASATNAAGASCARLATWSVRLGSRRSNAGPANERSPPTTWGSGSAGPSRSVASANSNARSVSGVAPPLV